MSVAAAKKETEKAKPRTELEKELEAFEKTQPRGVPLTVGHEDLCCIVCRDVYRDPAMLGCGHTFCSACLTTADLDPKATCPLCKTPVSSLAKNLLAKTLVDRLTVECPHCKTPVKRTALKDHVERDCDAVWRCNRCGTAVPSDEKEAHAKEECPMRHVRCAACGNRHVPFAWFSDHVERCPAFEYCCDNCGRVPKSELWEARRDGRDLDCLKRTATCPCGEEYFRLENDHAKACALWSICVHCDEAYLSSGGHDCEEELVECDHCGREVRFGHLHGHERLFHGWFEIRDGFASVRFAFPRKHADPLREMASFPVWALVHVLGECWTLREDRLPQESPVDSTETRLRFDRCRARVRFDAGGRDLIFGCSTWHPGNLDPERCGVGCQLRLTHARVEFDAGFNAGVSGHGGYSVSFSSLSLWDGERQRPVFERGPGRCVLVFPQYSRVALDYLQRTAAIARPSSEPTKRPKKRNPRRRARRADTAVVAEAR